MWLSVKSWEADKVKQTQIMRRQKKIGEKVDFEMARIFSLVLLFGFIYPYTPFEINKKNLIVCLIVFSLTLVLNRRFPRHCLG